MESAQEVGMCSRYIECWQGFAVVTARVRSAWKKFSPPPNFQGCILQMEGKVYYSSARKSCRIYDSEIWTEGTHWEVTKDKWSAGCVWSETVMRVSTELREQVSWSWVMFLRRKGWSGMDMWNVKPAITGFKSVVIEGKRLQGKVKKDWYGSDITQMPCVSTRQTNGGSLANSGKPGKWQMVSCYLVVPNYRLTLPMAKIARFIMRISKRELRRAARSCFCFLEVISRLIWIKPSHTKKCKFNNGFHCTVYF